MKARSCTASVLALVFLILIPDGEATAQAGHLIDAVSGATVADGVITVAGQERRADKSGAFRFDRNAYRVLARAPGYRAASLSVEELASSGGVLRLEPFTPRALYLTVYGIGSKKLTGDVLAIIGSGSANALVIDLKGDRGIVPYPSAVQLTTNPGARAVTSIPNLRELVETMHASGVYLIARIVVFKDDPLAAARPDLAIKSLDGELFKDGEGLAWTDPFQAEVRNYNIDLAVEAAQAGFDEIQFDYLRFPDSAIPLILAGDSSESARTDTITGFLMEARRRLAPYNVFVAVDMFGYVCWNTSDSGIGQKLEEIAPYVDYLSPMLYPSGFTFGIPGARNPVAESYSIVYASLEKARTRLNISPKRFRPWLQAFKDYAFDRRSFDADEVAEQIRAATDFGSDGWMLWNAHNTYSETGLGAQESLK